VGGDPFSDDFHTRFLHPVRLPELSGIGPMVGPRQTDKSTSTACPSSCLLPASSPSAVFSGLALKCKSLLAFSLRLYHQSNVDQRLHAGQSAQTNITAITTAVDLRHLGLS